MGVFSIWLTFMACGETDKDATDPAPQEEPSSEPAGEPSTGDSDEGSTDAGQDSGSGNGSSGSEGGSEDGSGGGSDPTTDFGTLNPDILLFSFYNGYVGGDVSEVTLSTGETLTGLFRIIMFDTMAEDYCAVDWFFDETTVAPDPEYADGLVPDGFSGMDLDVWYGFVVLSSPTTSGSCDALTSDWTDTLNVIKADRPGFGYGPLTPDLQSSMETEGYADWNSISDYVFAGIASSTAFSDGERAYFPVNQGYAYPIDSAGTTPWDSENHDWPQGTETPLADLPSDGFYQGQYYFGIGLQH